MDLKTARKHIDAIDEKMVNLLKERMETAAEIAAYKRDHHLPVTDSARERDVLNRAADLAGDGMTNYIKVFYSTIFDISKSYQTRVMMPESELAARIRSALERTEKVFPERAVVACQGVEGAYSQQACDKLFKLPNIVYFRHFEGVIQAVQSGLCRYGILPIENSSFGSVNQVYDLMRAHRFSIVRGCRMLIHHALLAKEASRIEDLREVYSHEQAIGQCSEFLRAHPNLNVNVVENTAAAAKMVAASERTDIAAISSRNCAELYALRVLRDDVQNNSFNYTRFICISKDMEIYPGANKISLIASVSHRPGALHEILAKFSALGVNLTKLESRPIGGRDFEFCFYFDFDASIYSPDVTALLSDLEAGTDGFTFLGAYGEV